MSCSTPTIRGGRPIRVPTIPLADSALILAGGKGKRLGYDKKKIELKGVNLLESIIRRLSRLFNEILISSNDPIEGYRVLKDELGTGPVAGIYQGLKHCSSEYLYVIACDMPFISGEYITYMRSILETHRPEACVAGALSGRNGRYEPLNAFYHKRCAAPMEAALGRGEYRIIAPLEGLDVHSISSETLDVFGGQSLFFNINTMQDLEWVQRSDYDLS